MTISQAQRQAVRERAGDCCEYCRMPASGGTVAFHVDMHIEGITPEGRTTVRVLRMNDSDRVENRQILAEIDEYPCSKS